MIGDPIATLVQGIVIFEAASRCHATQILQDFRASLADMALTCWKTARKGRSSSYLPSNPALGSGMSDGEPL
jgi:hypothetical protein